MDKQKQIEEMADCKACYNNFGRCPVKKRKYCSDYKNATNKYNKGCRKISEDAVVLTREEPHEIEENAYQVGVTMGKKFGGKEAAENYYQKMKVALGILCFGNQKIHDENNAIAKQFGVEVER